MIVSLLPLLDTVGVSTIGLLLGISNDVIHLKTNMVLPVLKFSRILFIHDAKKMKEIDWLIEKGRREKRKFRKRICL